MSLKGAFDLKLALHLENRNEIIVGLNERILNDP